MTDSRGRDPVSPSVIPTLGAGWAFPVMKRPAAAGKPDFAWAADEESVRQSIEIILSTSKGERAMRPDFGSRLHALLFTRNDGATRAAAEFEVREALREWEPRIELLDVQAEAGSRPEELLIHIAYRVRSTDSRFNLVYPFYLDRTVA
jgi:phage baseplate assembly protein W